MFGAFIAFIAGHILYFALHLESSSFPRPLSAQEEREAFEQMWNRDKDAREKLIRHNLRLVAHIAKKYYGSKVEQDDLISIGTIGLIKAVQSFSSGKGTRFATYAARCIENEILMQFRSDKKTSKDISISEAIENDKDGNALTLEDIMADEFELESSYEKAEAVKQLYKVVSMLSGRDRQVILMRYGLNDAKPMTQKEVSDVLGISRSYVSRIEKKALEQLKTALESVSSRQSGMLD